MIRILFLTYFLFNLNHTLFGQLITQADLSSVVRMMAGEFSSEEQSKTDSAFFHIKLRMKPIWKKNKDGYWLYVEQTLASAQDKP
jgi:hypothetical protein